jgi:hypothetical protein
MDVQATGEASCPQKKTSGTSKNEIYKLFCLKRELPALQKMKFINFFSMLWIQI